MMQAQQSGVELVVLDCATDGQAATAEAGLQAVRHTDMPVTIASCDAVCVRLTESIDGMLDNDLVVWTTEKYRPAQINPAQFAWVRVVEDGSIVDFMMKEAPEGPDWRVVVGTFSFRSTEFALDVIRRMRERDIRTNGELYLDNAIGLLLAEGAQVVSYCPESFVGIGTPEEYESFRYWQRVFARWPHHPYKTYYDPLVSVSDRSKLEHSWKTPNNPPWV